jgi:hypothetical protein
MVYVSQNKTYQNKNNVSFGIGQGMSIKYIIEDGKEYKVLIYVNGCVFWYLNEKCHREKGPAYIRQQDGYKEWLQNDFLHRLDGPAFIINGTKHWRINGEEFTEQNHTKVRTMLAFGLDKI